MHEYSYILLILGLLVFSEFSCGWTMQVDFSTVQSVISTQAMDGSYGELDPQTVSLEHGMLRLSAKNEPWGAPTETFLYKELQGIDIGGDWTIGTCLTFRSEFLLQQAGIFVGNKNKHLRLVVGRLQQEGSPFNAGLYGYDGRIAKAALPEYRVGDAIWLQLVRLNDKVWGFYSLDGENFTPVGYLPVEEEGVVATAGLCFVDPNKYNRQTRVQPGVAQNGVAHSRFFRASAGAEPKLLATLPKVYVRVRLLDVTPNDHPVKVAGTLYAREHERLFRFGLTKDGQVRQFDTDWHGSVHWAEISEDEGLKVGESTAWSDWSNMFVSPEPQMTLGLAFWEDGYPPAKVRRADSGNVQQISVEVDFASAPSDRAIVKTISYQAHHHTLGLYLRDLQRPFTVWGPKICTLRQNAKDRLQVYTERGAQPFPLAQRFVITGVYSHGYHGDLLDPEACAVEDQIQRLLGVNRLHITTISPLELEFAKFDAPDLEERLTDLIRERSNTGGLLAGIADKFAPEHRWSDIPAGEVYAKVWDEPHLITIDTIRESEEGKTRFREWLRQRGVSPQELGALSWEEVVPIKRDEVKTPEQARLYYLTVWFQQEEAAAVFGRFTQAFHAVHGDRVILGTDVFYAGFTRTPDYFIESRTGAFDCQVHHYGGGDRDPVVPHADFFIADILRSASQFGQMKPGVLWFVCRISQGEGTLLSGLTALAHGITRIHYYGYGPMWTRWEWFSGEHYKVDAFLAAHTISQMASKYENYLTEGRCPHAQVAMLLSRGAEIWDNTRLCERRMIHAALSWANYPVDVVPEEEVENGRLNNYRVLYVYEPNLSAKAQEAVATWVRRGGVLYLGPQAATRDEINQPHELLGILIGQTGTTSEAASEPSREFKVIGNFGEVWTTSDRYSEMNVEELTVLDEAKVSRSVTGKDFKFAALGTKEVINIPGSEVLARYSDGNAAMVLLRVGQGCVVKVGTCLGAAYARSAKPRFSDRRRDVEIPPFGTSRIDHYWRRKFNPQIHDLLLYPLQIAKVARSVECSVRGIDSGLFRLRGGRGALLLLGNWTTEDTSPLQVRVRTGRRYSHVRTFSGAPIQVKWYGATTADLTLALDTIEAVEFLP